MNGSQRRAETALAGVVFVWGSTFVLVKSALDDVSTLLFLTLRFLLAGIALAIACHGRLSGVFARGRNPVAGGALAGACLFAGYLFQTTGLRLTTPAKSAFLTGLSVVFVPALAALTRRTGLGRREWGGAAAAAAGMGLMTLEGGELTVNPGDLLTVVCALFFAAHVLVVGHFSRRHGFEILSVLQIVTAALLAAATFWWVEAPRVVWSPKLLAALAVTGLLATAAAFTVQAWAQQHISPARTALIFALEPIFAWATSFVVSGEALSGRAAAGAALILGGILVVELKPPPARRHPSQ